MKRVLQFTVELGPNVEAVIQIDGEALHKAGFIHIEDHDAIAGAVNLATSSALSARRIADVLTRRWAYSLHEAARTMKRPRAFPSLLNEVNDARAELGLPLLSLDEV